MNKFEKLFFDRYLPEILATLGTYNYRQAKKLVAEFLKFSIIETKKDGTFNRPLNYGGILIEKEKIDEETKKRLKSAREEGATNDDILWYWNLHEIDRRMLDKIDIYHRTAMYLQYKSDGLSDEQAIKKLFKHRPKWGEPSDTKYASSEDRPLPPELIDRVNRYIINRKDIEIFKKECEKSSSFNALIRREIKKWNI
jgi:hypothetical protein